MNGKYLVLSNMNVVAFDIGPGKWYTPSRKIGLFGLCMKFLPKPGFITWIYDLVTFRLNHVLQKISVRPDFEQNLIRVIGAPDIIGIRGVGPNFILSTCQD